MSNGNDSAVQTSTKTDTKTSAAKVTTVSGVVLVDNHTHEKIPRAKGEVIEFNDDRYIKAYPKVFALAGSAEATKAIADAKAAAEKAANDAKAAEDAATKN